MERVLVSLCAVVMLLAPLHADAAGNAATGAALFNRCALCHSATKGGGNKIGPNLFGVVRRKAGTYPGFSYSAAMKKSGIVWTPAKLDAYLAAPQEIVPGNSMPFAGIANAPQRADVVAYLVTLK
ncbi:MAG TPA: cytochrome c family protein [Rhizomicrobium sp.]|nr:cytochrome c family protein [Rhizomicrobium sp.]